MDHHYMIELDFFNPEVYESGSFEKIENIIVTHLHNCGRLVSLSISKDEAILWVVLKVHSEEELINIINSTPVEYELSYEYYFLNQYEVIQEIGSFSLN